MKFDISRAWKDEAYRQTLSTEELETLPTHPAGDLNEAALADVYGGGFPGIFGESLSSAASATTIRHHTLAGICDINVFSIRNPFEGAFAALNIARDDSQVCASI